MKIALVGSAPSSIHLAPYDDPSWLIWGCSPGAYPHLRRVDAFFEIHRWRPGEDGFTQPYIDWMAGLACPVYVIDPDDAGPLRTAVAYPKEGILDRYGRSFFTSSLAWMLALAIETIRDDRAKLEREPEGDEISLWGVDMAAGEEYGHQKPGCHYFIEKALAENIKVTVPPQSDLLQPLPLYGFGEASPMRIKLETRRKELTMRLAETAEQARMLDAQYQEKVREQAFVQGALDDLQYMLNTWVE